MFTFFEKFLFEKFRGMPRWVRIITYLVMLALFVYLMLMPRFINGQLIARDPQTGGHLPYRGVEMLIHVEGRDYKFTSNESGFWSIPIVPRMPTSVEVQVFHQDKGQWFPVRFDTARLWSPGDHVIEVTADKPYVALAWGPTSPERVRQALAALAAALVPNALAQLQIAPRAAPPPSSHGVALAPVATQNKVYAAIGAATGKPADAVSADFPLKGANAPTYFQRIKIIMNVEQAYDIKIPDEHWQAMTRAGDLADYVAKREALLERNPDLKKDPKASWPQIQQSLPPEQRPVFRR